MAEAVPGALKRLFMKTQTQHRQNTFAFSMLLILKDFSSCMYSNSGSELFVHMSPFSHFLHELRMRYRVRQVELAERTGYEQSYISALEAGLKGPPTAEFVESVVTGLKLSSDDAQALRAAAEASQRKLVIEPDMPQDIFWLLSRLRATLPVLTPTQVRVINDVLGMAPSPGDAWSEPVRRLRRRSKEELQM